MFHAKAGFLFLAIIVFEDMRIGGLRRAQPDFARHSMFHATAGFLFLAIFDFEVSCFDGLRRARPDFII